MLPAELEIDAVFVLGSAVPHSYPLHVGYYSVHTSAQALEAGDRRTASGTIPVFR